MSEPIKALVETPAKSFVFNKELAMLKLEEVKTFYIKFAGKPSHNPFFWIKDNIIPLEKQIKIGVSTKELYDSIMALPMDASKVFLSEVEEMHKAEREYIEGAKQLPPPPLPDRPTGKS